MGCASLFVVAGLIWPVLHFIGGNTEPEAMFIPSVIGLPAFLVAHVLAIVALCSRSPRTAQWGSRALGVMWAGIAIVIILGLLSWLVGLVRGRL